ncbi:RAI1 Decapping nuclease RAI1 [Candida maltosa Xu316]|uniref:Decapping nuclease n=1 Tax=Candida maltosa (strain Xu316) TaxID=1245528 RepID=M3HEA5_CANMX|nr:Protein RAI1 [Candida maltosa Xu316]
MSKSLPLNSRAKTTSLKQPKELFSYSRDINGEYHYDDNTVESSLSYYYLPDSFVDYNIDLQAGYSKFKKIPESENLTCFESLLRGIMNFEQDQKKKINGDIITFRGIMTKILSMPYNLANPIDLYLVPYDSQIFIDFDNEIELQRRTEQDTRLKQTNTPEKYEYIKKCEYSGYKFETIATIPKAWSETSRAVIDEKRFKQTVNNYEQYLSVIRTGIGNVKLVLGGEVDCCWDYLPEGDSKKLNHYVELKTSRIIENNMQLVNFEQKLFRTWCQCFLMGINKIVYGFRDDSCVLKNVELYNTEEIPLLIKNNPLTNANDGAKKINCTNALKWYGAVVEWINTVVDKSDESKSYKLKYDPVRKSFTISEVDVKTNDHLRNGGLLTKEFTEWRQTLK